MRKLLLALMLCFFASGTSFAAQVPKEVQDFVNKTFPNTNFRFDGVIILRSEHDAPEIDGVVYATSSQEVIPGDIETVKITKADEYDLFGEIVE